MRSQFRAGMLIAIVFMSPCGPTPRTWGQKPPPPVAPNPQAPVLAMPMPLGMQRGTGIDLTLTGSNLAGPTGLATGFPAKITIPTGDKNGLDNSKLKVHLDVAADVPLGYYGLRLATTRGMSNLRLFCIDDLPQVVETGTNHGFAAAQVLPVPCVVVGRVVPEVGSYFKITVAAGQRVSFDVLGHRLGSPIDPQLSIYSAKTKRELAHDNDSPGCQSDPRLTHVFKDAGDYIVEVKDVLNRGGPDFVYRLRVGDFPLATVPIPMAAQRGSTVKVDFAGPHVAGALPTVVAVPNDPAVNVVWVTPKGANGLHGWPVALAITDMAEGVEQEPNNKPSEANRLTVPGGVTGRFEHSDDTDCYVFAAKKGQKLTIEAKTLELYSPTLVYMVLKKSDPARITPPQPPLRKGGSNAADLSRPSPLAPRHSLEGGWIEIAKTDPQRPPPGDQRIDFTAPQDGDYLVEVQHLTYAGGPSEAYHLSVTPTVPSFDIALGLDRYDLAPGSYVPLDVVVTRRGYAGVIEVTAQGAPHLTAVREFEVGGSTTVKAGQTTATLLLKAKPDAPVGPYDVTLFARGVVDGKTVVQPVSVQSFVSAGLSGLTFPPLQLNNQTAIAVTEKAPFTLAASMDPPEAAPGIATRVILKVTRAPGFAEPITLSTPTGLPANVAVPKLTNIAKDKNEVKFALDINAKAPLGEYQVFFSGQAKVKDKEMSARAWPLALVVGQPFDLAITPAMLDLQPGGKAKLKISALRKGGYKGPISVELRKLPANVTAAKATIPSDKNDIDMELSAAASAAPGEKKDADALGTATALNNMQNASPAFTVRLRATRQAEQLPDYPPPGQVKAAFFKLLDRPKVPAAVISDGGKLFQDGFVLEELSFASEKKPNGTDERVPTLILKPAGAKGKRPAVIVLHGTGGSARGMLPVMKELAKHNIIGVAIDARYHGGRAGGAKGAAAYNAAIARAWRTKPGQFMEHPFYYDTCWDLWRLVDVLSTRDDIDAKRLGMIGFSMGGIETWLAASVDDRIRVAVPAIGVQSFRYSLDNDEWQGRANTISQAHKLAAQDLGEPGVNQKVCRALWNKVIPGILDQFDCPSMLRLFAGRSLLIIGGTKDPNCPYGGAKLAIASAERAFHDAKADDHLRVLMAPVGHTVTAEQREAALAWFVRWLK